MRKDIYLPHINYTVRVRDLRPAPKEIAAAKAWIRRNDRHSCTIYLPKNETSCGVAHELVHALQYICADRHIDFTAEMEHMAYLMQYLMARILGYSWKND